MAYILEKKGTGRFTLEAGQKEPFTRKAFTELIKDAHGRSHDYFIARIQTKETYTVYDARQLCKYLFEMLISTEGRKIRIKNFLDPLSKQEIVEVNFFKLKYDTETPLRAEYIGNQASFLESNSFRSKIFYHEDALDALSVNFSFKKEKKIPLIEKKKVASFIIVLIIVVIFGLSLLVFGERKKKFIGYSVGNKFTQ